MSEQAQSRLDGIKVMENNQVPILDNRFRVDHEVKEITLLFFRRPGTPPVILVKPDGSKMYATMAITGQADWFDEKTFDLIKITNPMPGPWQVVGQMAEGSKVLVITDFELNVDPLPGILVQGETIKLTGYVTNNGEPIRARNFKDVITMDVDFISTNKKEFENFGAGIKEVTSFVDNGKGYDERPGDGVFTGEFKLAFAYGEWIPKYTIRTPLMVRELEHDPVMVHPNPVKLSIETTDVPDEFHKLIINIEGDYVKGETLVFQGKIYYPNQEIQSFSITDSTPDAREFNVINYDFGLYRVEMSAFGENANGREFMLDIPEFSFSIDPPPVEEVDMTATGTAGMDGVPSEEDMMAQMAVEEEPVEEDNSSLLWLILVGNLLLVLIGWLVVKFFVQGVRINIPMPKLPKISLPKFKKGKKDDEEGEGNKIDKTPSEDDDILDLSMPES